MKFEIKNRFNGEIIFSIETENWRLAVEAAIKAKADLSGANLYRANLSEADLSRADLSGANLSRADLSGANLSEANLSRADLSGADLSGANLYRTNLSEADLSRANLSRANLSEADLSEADLYEANLSRADLSGADLSGADLSGANLYRANLSEADLSRANLSRANLSEADLSGADLSEDQLIQNRDDIWSILAGAPHEIPFLRNAIVDGKIDGSTYEGECACLCGTIAKAQNKNYKNLEWIKPNSQRPAEQFFALIKKGDTPETSKWSALALKWLDQFVENIKTYKEEI